MKTRSLFAAAAIWLALPILGHAAPFEVLNPVADNSVTLNLVQLSRPAQVPIDTSPQSWFAGVEQVSTAHMGLYFGQANEPPRSVVGWDFRHDLAAQVRYGIYLINRF